MGGGNNASDRLQWWQALVALIAAVVGTIAVSIGVGVIWAPAAPWRHMAGQVAVTAAVFSLVSWVVYRRYRVDVGWRFTPGAPVLAAVAIGALAQGVVVDEVLVGLRALGGGGADTGMEALRDAVRGAPPGWKAALVMAAVSVLPPLAEEWLFRGVVLSGLRRSAGWPAAVAGSAVLFGVVHGSWFQGTGAALFGVYLGWCAWKTGSLWPCVAAHAVNNAVWAGLARWWPAGLEHTWRHGHPPWLVAVAVAVLIATVALVHRGTRATGGSRFSQDRP